MVQVFAARTFPQSKCGGGQTEQNKDDGSCIKVSSSVDAFPPVEARFNKAPVGN
jgi:hypothetical protein